MGQVNFIVNGRTVIHKGSKGKASAASINFTGEKKEPVSYQVETRSEDLENLANGLQVEGNPCATIDSYTSRCTGDEAGDGGGIYSGTIGGRCDFLTASPDTVVSDTSFMVNGKPVVREGDVIVLNQRNSAPTQWEQAGGYSVHAERDKLIHPEEESSAFQLTVAVFGKEAAPVRQYLAISKQQDLQPVKMIPLGQHSEDSDSHWHRMYLKNLQEDDYYYMFYVLTEANEPVMIPFPAPAARPGKIEEETPNYYEEQTLLIPCKLSHHLSILQDKFAAKAGDFSDILLFDNELRWQIYGELVHHQLGKADIALENKETKSDNFFQMAAFLAEDETEEKLLDIKDFEQSWYEILSPPIRFLVDEALKNMKSETSLQMGYLYVWVNGYLWRELLLNEKGQLSEVDLALGAGKEIRAAKGLSDNFLYLPQKVAGESLEIELAFSDIQWSWARILYYGGVDEKDPRFKQCYTASDKSTAAEARETRFIKVDLSAYSQENIQQETQKGEQLVHALLDGDDIPTIFMPNPLLAVTKTMQDIHFLIERLEEQVDALHKEPYFLTAMASYRYFFDKRVAHDNVREHTEAEIQKQKAMDIQVYRKRYSCYHPDYLKEVAEKIYPQEVWTDLSHEARIDKLIELHLQSKVSSGYARLVDDSRPNEFKEFW